METNKKNSVRYQIVISKDTFIKIGDCEITIIGVLNEISTRLNNN